MGHLESHLTKKSANFLNFHPTFPQVLKFHLWLCGLNFCRSAKTFTKNIFSPCRLTKWEFYFELKVSLFPKIPRHSEFHCKITVITLKILTKFTWDFLRKSMTKVPLKNYTLGDSVRISKNPSRWFNFCFEFFCFCFHWRAYASSLGIHWRTGVLTGVLELHWHTYWRTWDSLAYLSFTGVLGIHWRTAYLGFTTVAYLSLTGVLQVRQ